MTKRHTLLSLLLTLCTPSLFADSWIGSLELGYTEQTFNTSVSGPLGAIDYTNRARGFDLGLVGGYEFEINESFYIAGIARGSWTNAEWEYTLAAEPASFHYAIPFTLGVGIQPRIVIADPISLVGEAGVQWGYVEQRKDGPLTDGYDENSWKPGYVLGGGIEFAVDECIAIRFNYRHVWYDTYDFQSVNALGVPIWNVQDSPQVNTLTLAAIIRF